MNAIAVIVSVIGAVLAVALALLLIWRVLATIQVGLYHALLHPLAQSDLLESNALHCELPLLNI